MTGIRKAEERRRQTFCDRRDNNYVQKIFPPNFTFAFNRSFVNDLKSVTPRVTFECHTQTFFRPLLSAVLLRKLTMNFA